MFTKTALVKTHGFAPRVQTEPTRFRILDNAYFDRLMGVPPVIKSNKTLYGQVGALNVLSISARLS